MLARDLSSRSKNKEESPGNIFSDDSIVNTIFSFFPVTALMQAGNNSIISLCFCCFFFLKMYYFCNAISAVFHLLCLAEFRSHGS